VWFDSHCHLHLCEENAPVGDVVARARASGTSEMLTLGIDLESSRRALDIACVHGLWAAAGVHPNSAAQWNGRTAAAIEELLGHERVVAVGESGLDFYREHARPADQEEAFRAHIELARRLDLALVIHTRSSASRALDMLSEEGPPTRFVFHCWSGGERELARALELGAYISFAGNVTFPRADELRAAAAVVPEARLLIETDAPFLSPAPHRGAANEPARVPLLGATVARARDVDAARVGEITSANARRLLALPGR
jgi:TatD DNase family protein